MKDVCDTQSSSLIAPLVGGFAVTPIDATDLPSVTREIYAATAGKVNAVWKDGGTFAASVGAGERVPWWLVRVLATGTTATGIEGFY